MPPFGPVFGALFLGLIIHGFVHARVSVRHPELLKQLGQSFVPSKGVPDTLDYNTNWFKFALWQHFAIGDVVLSVLCVVYAAVGLGAVGALIFALLADSVAA